MRFFLILFIGIFFNIQIFAEEQYLPESADPKSYIQLSKCYSHDDVTFYQNGSPIGDREDYADIKIDADGCYATLHGKILGTMNGFDYYDKNGNNPITVIPDSTVHPIPFGNDKILIDKKYLYYMHRPHFIPVGMDISNIKLINSFYFTDGKNLYSLYGGYDGKLVKIEGIDISSLQTGKTPNDLLFMYDKNGLYIEGDLSSIKENPDGSLTRYFLKQYKKYDFKTMIQSGTFLFDSINVYTPSISASVDMASFRISEDEMFAQDKNHIYTPTGKVISGIDISNYIYLGNGIIRSHDKLFMTCKPEIDCDGYELTGFDVASFRVISTGYMDNNGYYDFYFNPMKKPQLDLVIYTGSATYYHDSKNVFSNIWQNEYQILTGAKLQSFTTFSGTSYARDSHFCWFEGIRFSCNAKTFTPIEGWRSKDKKNVYYQDKKIIGADPHSFTGINTGGFNWIETYHYMRDKNRIYYDHYVIRDSDPKTFELMKDLHAKDRNNIYYAGWKIEGADYSTFIPLRYSFARDKNHFYFAGITLGRITNPEKVTIVDRNHLGYEGIIQYYEYFKSESIKSYVGSSE